MKRKIGFPFIALFLIIGFSNCKTSTKKAQAPTEQVAQPTFKYHHEIRQPKVKSENSPVLILLHGYGSNEKDLFSFAEYLDDRLMVIAPRAPQTLASNKYKWYSLNPTESELRYDGAEVLQTSKDIMIFVEEVISNYKVDPQKVYIGGFSQGAILTLGTGLLNSEKIAGVVCLSGHLYPEFAEQIPLTQGLNGLSIFISHGRQDKVLAFSKMDKDAAYLKNKGIDVTARFYDSAHNISQENFRDMLAWLTKELD